MEIAGIELLLTMPKENMHVRNVMFLSEWNGQLYFPFVQRLAIRIKSGHILPVLVFPL